VSDLGFRKVATLDNVWSGETLQVVMEGRKIVLVNVEGTVRAYEDRCLHMGVELSRGKLHGCILECSAHAWRYDALTGEGVNPKGVRLAALPVRVEGEDILVDDGAG
jgi:toluene monooxygenase system ferredoxin subunit